MILFLNGPFGVGKTTVAKALVEKLPRATPEISTDGLTPAEVADWILQSPVMATR